MGITSVNPIIIELLTAPKHFLPGEHHVIIFKITNTQRGSLFAEVELELPKGWQLVTRPVVASINSGESKRFIFTVSLLSKVAYGTKNLTLIVREKATKKILLSKSVAAEVKKHHNLVLEQYQKPNYTRGGTDFECVYRLTNKGNIDEAITIKSIKGTISGVTDTLIRIDSTLLITVKQKAPEIRNQPQTVVNDLVVYSQAIDSVLTVKTPVTAYPNNITREDAYYKFPVTSSWMFDVFDSGKEQLNILKYNISGNGFLDREEKHQLKFIAKGTNRTALKRIENYSRYMLNYSNDKFDISLGDFTLSVSRLLEKMRLGRGVLYQQKRPSANYHLFYNKLLFFPEIKDQFGGKFQYVIKDNITLGFNAIWRNFTAHKGIVYTHSLTGSYKTKNFSMEGEYAMSFQQDNIGGGAFIKGVFKKKSILLMQTS